MDVRLVFKLTGRPGSVPGDRLVDPILQLGAGRLVNIKRASLRRINVRCGIGLKLPRLVNDFGKHRRFTFASHQKEHVSTGVKHFSSQRNSLLSTFRMDCDPAGFIGGQQLHLMGENRRSVSVGSHPQQHDIE